ncbi:hypothetical protein [Polymorphum gilvum]|uniref:Uncharacterized protein n=1 Tax=Polymorphum gilvum (strain LMG 25793 / CGMCC 1.9160 / SL003B-26A1) TaxID=991905 RepID=F2J5K8_POLGS|nr:hypothetical protein [Polymorphum gilvum]ADZ72378.1 hypothetical protein SL003B_3958 [Polymorphum gilvum SL003B-26A1]
MVGEPDSDPLLRRLRTLVAACEARSGRVGDAHERLRLLLLRQDVKDLLAAMRIERDRLAAELSRLQAVTISAGAYARCGARLSGRRKD